jgi:hypothetical protein
MILRRLIVSMTVVYEQEQCIVTKLIASILLMIIIRVIYDITRVTP